MNALTSPTGMGYGNQAVRTTRDTEYDAISRVTRMLHQSDPMGRSLDAIAAVHKNNELWTLLAGDLAHDGNQLPDGVRAGLLSLAAFSLRHGHAVLAGQAPTAPLIEINMSILRGLRGEGGA